MAGERSYANLGASRVDLEQAALERVDDAEALINADRYASAIAMELYALEITLKALICKRLDLNQLPLPFQIHELDGLLIVSGLQNAMNNSAPQDVRKNWEELLAKSRDLNQLRYGPSTTGKQEAEKIRDQIHNATKGVLTWLRSNS